MNQRRSADKRSIPDSRDGGVERDELLGAALRDAAGLLAAEPREPDFAALYARAELRELEGELTLRARRRFLALALPLAGAASLALVVGAAGLGRREALRDEIAALSSWALGAPAEGASAEARLDALAAGPADELGRFVERLWGADSLD